MFVYILCARRADYCSGASEIAAHPREISSLVRRGDETRKTKRAARAERKAAERAAQQEETKAKKGKTRREMSKQLKTLREELGDDGLNWDQLEKAMEGDYQEEEWERVVGDMLQKAAEKVSPRSMSLPDLRC